MIYELLLGIKINSIELRVLLGMGSLGMLSQLICLSVPITWPVQLSVVICGLLPWLNKKFRSDTQEQAKRIYFQQPLIHLVFISLFTLTIVLAAGPIIRDDTESYHLQSIKWMHEYGTVSGLANLHSRYGFNSIWLSLISLVTPESSLNFYTCCNAILSLVVCSSLTHLYKDKKEKGSISLAEHTGLITLALLILIWYYWRGNAQSTNYDYYFLSFCLIVSVQFKEKLIKPNQLLYIFLIAPPLLFCIRPIYAPMMSLSLFSLYKLYRLKQKRVIVKAGLLYVLFTAIFLWRNVRLSGYVLFPSTLIDIAEVKWKMPKEYAAIQWEYINNYAWDRSLNIVEAGWKWLNEQFFYDSILFLLGFASIVFLYLKKKDKSVNTIVSITLLLMITTWISISPEPRFIAGIFMAAIFLAASNIAPIISASPLTKPVMIIAIGSTLILFPWYLVIQKMTKEGNAYINVLQPAKIPAPKLQKISTDDFNANIPDKIPPNWNKRCYLTPLPCVYDSVPGVRLIGNTIKDGFYVEYVAPRKISEN
jgi:hypothetical protein